jgi:carbon-monoxide dehydrogenase medium subunit
MKPPVFTYHRPESLSEALEMLSEFEDARILAGGQSLMPMMNFRYVMPEHIIDINRIPEIAKIEETANGLKLGAMVRHNQAKESGLVAKRCPLIAYGMAFVAHVQIRNRGTVGGSLSHMDPSAEWPALLAVHDAVLHVQSRESQRDVPIGEWSRGFMTPNIEEGEMLVGVSVPAWPGGHTYGFGKIDRAAIALTGVDTGPVRLPDAEEMLMGQSPSDALFREAAAEAQNVTGLDDVHASAAYRRKIAVVMARRALEEAMARHTGEEMAA